MNAPLLNPDNKLLSWSINDLGLYGAAITPETLAAAQDRQATPAPGAGDPAARPGDDPRSGDAINPQNATADSEITVGEVSADGAVAGSLASVAPAAAPPAMQISMLEAPSLPTPGAPAEFSGGSGSGVFVPAPVPPPTTATVPTALDAMGATPQSLSPATLPPATEVIGPVLSPIAQPVLDPVYATATAAAGALQPVVTEAAGTIAAAADTLQGVTQPVVETAVDTATAATEAVIATSTDAVEAVADTAATATETVADTAAAATGAVADTATEVTETVTPQISAVVGTLADTASPAASDAVDAAASAVGDLLTGVGGTDPAGGVETLVGMVAAADEYDLTQIATTPVAPAASIVDLLAVDVDAPILGDIDPDDQPDDGPVGLFGL